MSPAILDLHIVRGVSFGPIVIQCKDASGTPVDMTDWAAFSSARRSIASDVAFTIPLAVHNKSGGYLEDGQVILEFSIAQGMMLPVGEFNYDIVLLHPNGKRLGPYVSGTVTVEDINTRPA